MPYFLHRSCSKNQEILAVPNLTLAPFTPSVYPKDNHTPGRGAGAIPRQELLNGNTPATVKLSHSSVTSRAEDMDTDGEIDVDDCDDGKNRRFDVRDRKITCNQSLLNIQILHDTRFIIQ